MTSQPSALITGGSRGIGYGIAAHLAVRGWSLTLAARSAEQLKKAQTCLEQLGGQVQIVSADLPTLMLPRKLSPTTTALLDR